MKLRPDADAETFRVWIKRNELQEQIAICMWLLLGASFGLTTCGEEAWSLWVCTMAGWAVAQGVWLWNQRRVEDAAALLFDDKEGE